MKNRISVTPDMVAAANDVMAMVDDAREAERHGRAAEKYREERKADKASRRAVIARWAMANQAIGDVEVDAGTLTPAKIRAFREVCMSGFPLAEDCDVAVGDLVLDDGDSDDNIAMATDRIVDAINARVRSRSKES